MNGAPPPSPESAGAAVETKKKLGLRRPPGVGSSQMSSKLRTTVTGRSGRRLHPYRWSEQICISGMGWPTAAARWNTAVPRAARKVVSSAPLVSLAGLVTQGKRWDLIVPSAI